MNVPPASIAAYSVMPAVAMNVKVALILKRENVYALLDGNSMVHALKLLDVRQLLA